MNYPLNMPMILTLGACKTKEGMNRGAWAAAAALEKAIPAGGFDIRQSSWTEGLREFSAAAYWLWRSPCSRDCTRSSLSETQEYWV